VIPGIMYVVLGGPTVSSVVGGINVVSGGSVRVGKVGGINVVDGGPTVVVGARVVVSPGAGLLVLVVVACA
jgi:hypothetical protein